jgi:predicted nucleic acid-binding protein
MDSSSVVKLYVDEPEFLNTRQALALAEGIAASVICYAEVRAAFAAKARNHEFSERELQRLIRDFNADWPSFYTIGVSGRIVQVAGDLIDSHILSGFDAIHLASAMEFRNQSLDVVDIATADTRLKPAPSPKVSS